MQGVAVVFVFFVNFKSIAMTIRGACTLALMLGFSFALAILVYQVGLGDMPAALSPGPSGALCWYAPTIALAICVGLGLDYDILFSEALLHAYKGETDDGVETDDGLKLANAVETAQAETRTVISAAGVIMIISFLPLLLCNTLLLNQVRRTKALCVLLCCQVGFILIVGVFIDCFVTTAFVIPFGVICLSAYFSVDNFSPGKISWPNCLSMLPTKKTTTKYRYSKLPFKF